MSTEEPSNDDCVNVQRPYANGQPLLLAMREMHSIAGSRRFWMALAAVVLVLAVAAPFDTAAHFPFSTLLVYWGMIAGSTFFVAVFTSVVVSAWVQRSGLPEVLGSVAGGMVAGLPVTLVVVAFNRIFFGINPFADHGLTRFFLECTLITMAVFTLIRLTKGSASGDALPQETEGDSETDLSEPAAPSPAMPRTRLHQRLASDLGNDIVSLQAQDHYVDVTTTAGHELILMRLADAEGELQGLPGVRVHRSWWIAEHHMKALRRDSHRVLLQLDTGIEVPVSRSSISALRKLLARREES